MGARDENERKNINILSYFFVKEIVGGNPDEEEPAEGNVPAQVVRLHFETGSASDERQQLLACQKWGF